MKNAYFSRIFIRVFPWEIAVFMKKIQKNYGTRFIKNWRFFEKSGGPKIFENCQKCQNFMKNDILRDFLCTKINMFYEGRLRFTRNLMWEIHRSLRRSHLFYKICHQCTQFLIIFEIFSTLPNF